MLYCYAKANTMEGHAFNDDVAIVKAKSKKKAKKKLLKLYDKSLLKGNVHKVRFNWHGIFIATDY